MALAFNIGSNWSQVISGVYSSSNPDDYIFERIKPITLYVGLNAKYLMVLWHNPTAPESWSYAGKLQLKCVPRAGPMPIFQEAIVPLRVSKVIKVELPSYPYDLRLEFAKWHRKMAVEIWEYIGPE